MPHKKLKRSQKAVINNSTRPADINPTWVFLRRYWSWIIVALIILFVASIRLRLLQIPLERDEGEFAYMGQLILQGIPPYFLAYNMKLPGIYAIYALIMAIFGQTIIGIHIGLLVFNVAAIVLLFLLARKLFDDITGIVAAFGYALLSLSPSVLGTSAHATQFIVPFALVSTLILLKALDIRSFWMIFASGILYGLTFIIKQHAGFYIIFAVCYFIAYNIIKTRIGWKKITLGACLLSLASAIPYFICCVLLYVAGVFPKFWFWTFTYAHQYVSERPLSIVPRQFIEGIYQAIHPWEMLLAMAVLGLLSIFWDEKAKYNRLFLLMFSFFSLLTVFPGFYFTCHYFVTLFPAIALLAGVAVSAIMRSISFRKISPLAQTLFVIALIITLVFPVYILKNIFFKISPVQLCRYMYGSDPFPESIEIADYIKSHTTENDKLAIIGSEPQIYFYSNRKSATGYIYTYGLMESQGYATVMQQEMIHEIETTLPNYIVLVDNFRSWNATQYSNMMILKWSEDYMKKYYHIVGIVNNNRYNRYSAFWADDLRKYIPNSKNMIIIVERIR